MTTMAIALALTGLMLYASVESNANNKARISRLEEANRNMSTQQSAQMTAQNHEVGEVGIIASMTQSEKERAEQAPELKQNEFKSKPVGSFAERREMRRRLREAAKQNAVTTNDATAPVVDPTPAEPTITPEMEQLKTDAIPHGTEIHEEEKIVAKRMDNGKVATHECKNC